MELKFSNMVQKCVQRNMKTSIACPKNKSTQKIGTNIKFFLKKVFVNEENRAKLQVHCPNLCSKNLISFEWYMNKQELSINRVMLTTIVFKHLYTSLANWVTNNFKISMDIRRWNLSKSNKCRTRQIIACLRKRTRTSRNVSVSAVEWRTGRSDQTKALHNSHFTSA